MKKKYLDFLEAEKKCFALTDTRIRGRTFPFVFFFEGKSKIVNVLAKQCHEKNNALTSVFLFISARVKEKNTDKTSSLGDP